MEDLEDGGPLEATTDPDAAGGPTRVKWRRCPSEDGGPLKMEVPKPKSLRHNNGATFQLHAKALPKYIRHGNGLQS